MFKFVGWVVVFGFALYGFTQFVGNHVVEEKPREARKGSRHDENRSA
jgi:hypothetical protein